MRAELFCGETWKLINIHQNSSIKSQAFKRTIFRISAGLLDALAHLHYESRRQFVDSSSSYKSLDIIASLSIRLLVSRSAGPSGWDVLWCGCVVCGVACMRTSLSLSPHTRLRHLQQTQSRRHTWDAFKYIIPMRGEVGEPPRTPDARNSEVPKHENNNTSRGHRAQPRPQSRPTDKTRSSTPHCMSAHQPKEIVWNTYCVSYVHCMLIQH